MLNWRLCRTVRCVATAPRGCLAVLVPYRISTESLSPSVTVSQSRVILKTMWLRYGTGTGTHRLGTVARHGTAKILTLRPCRAQLRFRASACPYRNRTVTVPVPVRSQCFKNDSWLIQGALAVRVRVKDVTLFERFFARRYGYGTVTKSVFLLYDRKVNFLL